MAKLETSADKADYYDLPKVSFREITDDKSLLQPAGVSSVIRMCATMHKARYSARKLTADNDYSLFERPEHYIRYIEPIESELAVQVEYDMDEQEWLDRVNAERKKDQSGPVSYEVFEIVMDKLEKEWFNLVKRIPQPASHLPVEDSKCAICDDGEGENSNAIVFCDGCNLAVHQDCYGVPYIPEGQWLCRKCTVSPENPVSCLFCPNEGGAFKQTSTGHWSHLLCAIWIPELSVGNAIYMEPVDGVEHVPKNRWKLLCSLCKDKQGACIQCDNRTCFTAFHVTCARQAGLLMSMKMMGDDGQLRAYCYKHLPPDWRRDLDDEDRADDDEADGDYGEPAARQRQRTGSVSRTVTTKMARAHAKSYRPGPPIVPHVILQTLLYYIGKVSLRRKKEFVERLCRYWSLKREARRGAPLLKRLHLEPWTASNAGRQETDAEKAQKLEFLTMLRTDIERVRMLAEQARKREKEKLRAAQLLKYIVDQFIFPHYASLSVALQRIRAMDRSDIFLQPVNRAEVPDYFDVIKEPMCWAVIEDKLDRNTYHTIAEFKHDVLLVLDNAMIYNPKESSFYRAAARMKKNAGPILLELDALAVQSTYHFAGVTDELLDDLDDLEPSDLLLHCLDQPDRYEPNRTQLDSLFAYELERPRTPTPPLPPKKAKKSRPSAAQTWEEREAKRLLLQASTGRTRASRAAVQAFSHEAGVEPSPEPATPRRMSRRGEASAQASSLRQATTADDEESPAIKALRKPQRGVIGLESIQVLTDRERRERERNLDLITADIDAQEQYSRFNVGWILPEGSKRRRSERLEDVKPPRPGKKQSSQAPLLDAASSLSPPPDEVPQAGPSGTRAARRASAAASPSPEPPSSSALTSDGEEAPPARASRGSRSKAASPVPAETSSLGGQTKSKQPRDSEGGVGVGRRRKINTSPAKAELLPEKVAKGKTKANTKETDEYAVGQQVWAKAASYPFFPAVIVDPLSEVVPPNVLDLQPDESASLVRFYDKTQSWAWVPIAKLAPIMADAKGDARFLASKNFKSSSMKSACAAAYRAALSAREEGT